MTFGLVTDRVSDDYAVSHTRALVSAGLAFLPTMPTWHDASFQYWHGNRDRCSWRHWCNACALLDSVVPCIQRHSLQAMYVNPSRLPIRKLDLAFLHLPNAITIETTKAIQPAIPRANPITIIGLNDHVTRNICLNGGKDRTFSVRSFRFTDLFTRSCPRTYAASRRAVPLRGTQREPFRRPRGSR